MQQSVVNDIVRLPLLTIIENRWIVLWKNKDITLTDACRPTLYIGTSQHSLFHHN
jgi:hypothetical protein